VNEEGHGRVGGEERPVEILNDESGSALSGFRTVIC
jgi:hypothetical protein